MRMYVGGGIAPLFLTSTLHDELSASRLSRYTPGTRWMCPRAGLAIMGKRKVLPLPGIEHQPPSP